MFDSLFEKLQLSIKLRGGEPLLIPNGLEKCISIKGDGMIRSWLWQVPGFRRWRITRLEVGTKLQVLNSVAYPDSSNDQPLMGIDLLWFGSQNKLVAVLDFQPLIQDQHYLDKHFKDLKSLSQKFPEFNNNQLMYSFDPTKYFSPWVLFCRGGLAELEGSLPKVYQNFLDSYWKLTESNSETPSEISSDQVIKLQYEYNIYSSQKDPAHGLFVRYFGEEWTARYLNEFLFPRVLEN